MQIIPAQAANRSCLRAYGRDCLRKLHLTQVDFKGLAIEGFACNAAGVTQMRGCGMRVSDGERLIRKP